MTTEQSAQALESCPTISDDDIVWMFHQWQRERGTSWADLMRKVERIAIANATAWNRRHQPAAAQLAGWKLVPVEPTPEQIQAGVDFRGKSALAIYGAMLEAAPPPPTQPKEPSNG